MYFYKIGLVKSTLTVLKSFKQLSYFGFQSVENPPKFLNAAFLSIVLTL